MGTNDGTTTKLYIDGQLEKTYAETLSTGSGTINLGYQDVGGTAYWSGEIDEIRLYRRVLSTLEISMTLSDYSFHKGSGPKVGSPGPKHGLKSSGRIARLLKSNSFVRILASEPTRVGGLVEG